MLGYDHYYYGTIRSLVASFGYLFSGIEIKRIYREGDKLIKVPLHYAPQDKIYQYRKTEGNSYVQTYPRMAFEFNIGGVDNTRKTSKQSIHSFGTTMQDGVKQVDWARNFVPYNFDFQLYLIATDIQDCLQIIEQILPHFQPSLTIRIKPFEQYPDFETDVTVIMNNVSNDFQYEGDLSDDTIYQWTLSFTLQGFLFSPVQSGSIGVIDVASINMKDWGFAKDEISQAITENATNE
jgi:hypothetical protein